MRVSHEHDFTDIVLDSAEIQNRFTVADMKALILTIGSARAARLIPAIKH
jgi:hypothetical protein